VYRVSLIPWPPSAWEAWSGRTPIRRHDRDPSAPGRPRPRRMLYARGSDVRAMTLSRSLLVLAAAGNLRTTTLRAFSQAEFTQVISG
jgi:hypothetical protein